MPEIRRSVVEALHRTARHLRNKNSWDISDIVDEVDEFRPRLSAAKKRCSLPAGFDWYPYDSFSSIAHLKTLLTGERRKLLALAEGYPVLDAGCGDGHIAYFFEHLGFPVHAVDHHSTNYNGLTGVRALRTELRSSIEIYDVDFDKQFTLPQQTYGLVLFFGVLYHLKNPFYVLEALSLRARYCLLSTRIARFTPDHATDLRDIPMAYLVDDGETNDDDTNYWIFSEAGLKRLLKRAGWTITDFMSTGARVDSDPVLADKDQRAFCLLESRYTTLDIDARLAEGWFDLDGKARWTARRFSFVLPRPVTDASTAKLYFRFYLPEITSESRPTVTLGAHVNGYEMPSHTFPSTGEHSYEESIPQAAMSQERLEIVFETNDALRPPPPDRRELGVLVPFDGRFPLIVA